MAANGKRGASRRTMVAIGAGLAAFGAFVVAVGAGYVPMDPASIRVPLWVVECVGAGLALLGAGLLAQPFAPRLTGAAARAGMSLAFAVSALWIAFGDGVRDCATSFQFGFAGGRAHSSGFECRAAFGLGAVLVAGVVVAGLGSMVPGRWGDRLESGGAGIIGVLLAAVLAVGVVVASPVLLARWASRRLYARLKGSDGSDA